MISGLGKTGVALLLVLGLGTGLGTGPGSSGGLGAGGPLDWARDQISLGDLIEPPILPVWVERWLYNAPSRTEEGLEALEEGRTDDAIRQLDRAARLDPESPTAAYNAGTAHLMAGERDAAGLLDAAAEAADAAGDEDLALRAHFNRGNAHLEAGDPAAAIAAFRETLRRDPSHPGAKRNLEIARQELERQSRLPLKRPQESPQGDRPGEKETSDDTGGDGPRDPDDEPSPEDQGPSDPGEAGDGGEGDRRPEPRGGEAGSEGPSLLDRFVEQGDLTTEQAAALLAAVDTLERRQRRRLAMEETEDAGRSKRKDW